MVRAEPASAEISLSGHGLTGPCAAKARAEELAGSRATSLVSGTPMPGPLALAGFTSDDAMIPP